MKGRALIIVFVSIFCYQQSNAQSYNLSIGPEINIPSGNSSNISSIGFGGGLKAEIGLSQKFSITANGSVVSFLGRKYFGVTSPAETSIPVKAGLKYYTSPGFYFEGQFGVNLPISGNANTGFAWSPGLGTFIKLRNSENKIDIGIRYEGWSSNRLITATNAKFSTFGFIGLRAAYTLNL